MPPKTLPTMPGGLLDQLLSMCDEHGWGRDGLDHVRMADDGGEGGDAGDGGTDGDETDPADLGEKGKLALAAERQARADADKARKAAEKKAKDLEAQLAAASEGTKTEHEKAIEAARKEAAAAAKAELGAELAKERIANALVRAAAGVLDDPNDAVIFLAEKVEVDDDGKVDQKKVAAMVAKLAEQKPGLAANANRKPGTGSFDGGARDGKPSAGVAAGRDMFAARRPAKSST